MFFETVLEPIAIGFIIGVLCRIAVVVEGISKEISKYGNNQRTNDKRT